MSNLSDFLARNSVSGAGTLPLIHSAQAYHIKSIRSSNTIIASKCNVFKSDKLNYFFVGRPAYKHRSGNGKAQYWELPC